MAVEVTMPKLGLTMVEGTISKWEKQEGQEVEKDEILLVIETEKVSYEINSPINGNLAKIIAQEGDVVPVGGVMAYIAQPGEKFETGASVKTSDKQNREVIGDNGKSEIPALESTLDKKPESHANIKASPLAKKIAYENELDLSQISGSGPSGRITKKDVLNAISEKNKAVGSKVGNKESEVEIIPITMKRRTIATRMSQSFQTIPHFWLHVEVDATEMKRDRKLLIKAIEEQTNGIRLSYTDIMIKLVSKAISEHPLSNATWTEEGIKLFKEINIGLAIDLPDGLMVPVIKDVGTKTLSEICVCRKDIVDRARNGKLTIDELTSGTFTFNNVGGFGVSHAESIINPPESCILSIGSIIDRPVVVNKEIVIKPIFYLSLACDHRIFDGGSSSRLLGRIKSLIEKPITILI